MELDKGQQEPPAMSKTEESPVQYSTVEEAIGEAVLKAEKRRYTSFSILESETGFTIEQAKTTPKDAKLRCIVQFWLERKNGNVAEVQVRWPGAVSQWRETPVTYRGVQAND